MWAKDADSTVAASSYAVLLCLMGATFVALYTPYVRWVRRHVGPELQATRRVWHQTFGVGVGLVLLLVPS